MPVDDHGDDATKEILVHSVRRRDWSVRERERERMTMLFLLMSLDPFVTLNFVLFRRERERERERQRERERERERWSWRSVLQLTIEISSYGRPSRMPRLDSRDTSATLSLSLSLSSVPPSPPLFSPWTILHRRE